MMIHKWSKGVIMRTEHYLFHVLGITAKSRTKVCDQWMILKLPSSLIQTVLRR